MDRLDALPFDGISQDRSSIDPREDVRPQRTKANMRRDWIWWILLLTIVTLVWCSHYNRWTKASWEVAVNYVGDRSWDMTFTGDALWGMAATKAMADGEIAPILPKYPISLGAPFRANWNDFPSIEEGVNAWWALLARMFGIFVGSNLALLCAHLLAATSFYWTCRYLGYNPALTLMGAALFALSRYAFWRNLPNLSLTYYWHLPLGLLVAWWCIRPTPVKGAKKWFVCVASTVLFGVQSPYFSGMFMQLLFWAAFFSIARTRDWRRAMAPATLALVLVATVGLMNLDTMYSRIVDGPNVVATRRDYAGIERYALRPVELFLPRSHSLAAFSRWANEVYFETTMIPGEEGSVYLGIVGILALAMLAYASIQAVAKGDLQKVSSHFWCVCLIVAFSIIGGLNGLAGLLGFWLFRASNRYSIVILAVLLLFLVKQLNLLTRRWPFSGIAALSVFLLSLGIYDQVPPRYPELELAARRSFLGEKKLVSQIEARLPENSKVFQLPVYDFPEGPQINNMRDYEHFRPYLHSHTLRFSYGAIKGRDQGRWQKEAEQSGPYHLVKLLEEYGFSAVLLNKHGYADGAASLIEELRSRGKSHVLARSDDWVCIALNPVRRPTLPPGFGVGWYPLEPSNWRWSSGDATVAVYNYGPDQRTVDLNFGLAVLNRRYVEIVAENRILFDGVVDSAGPRPMSLKLNLRPGRNEVRFRTDRPGEFFPGDSRKLAFSVIDFKVK